MWGSCFAIPGLGGHAFDSFVEPGGKHMWLRDALPEHVEGVRVFTYGYNTALLNSRSFQDLEALASTFRRHILALRRRVPVGD